MNSLKDIRINGLKGLRENSFNGLKISGLKNLILKPEYSGTEDINDAELEDLAKRREDIKREIKKLNQEKKVIETRIHFIQKKGKEKSEEITEFPWREEIFPPLPRKTHIKMPEIFEVKDNSLHVENSGLLEVKDGGMKIKDRGTGDKPEDNTPEEKISENMVPTTIQAMTINYADGDQKNETGKNENKIPNMNSRNDSIEKSNPENKNNPAASLPGKDLIEELLGSDDLNPENEQGFMKYLQEPEMGELINDLKNVKFLLVRESMQVNN